MADTTQIEKKLKDAGYKLTNPRKAILDVLIDHQGQFLSAEEIFKKAKAKYAPTNFSTIYRNLEILSSIGILHKTQIHSGSSSYELVCTDNHHHHIICKGCGKTETIDFCPLERVHDQLGSKHFTLTDHKFELYGYCEDCHRNTSK